MNEEPHRTSGQPTRKCDHAGLILLCAAVFAVLCFLVHEIYSHDIWWHVTIGSDILGSGSVPHIDKYSAAAMGRAYHDSHWLFQIIMALAHSIGGMAGVQVMMILIWLMVLSLCFASVKRWVSLPVAVVMVFFAAMASVERFIPRPELITFLGIAGFYMLLQEGKYRSWKGPALFVLLQVLWTNSHGLFVIGPFMVGCYWLSGLIDKLRGRGSELGRLSLLLALVLASTAITPYGLDNWQYAMILIKEAAGYGPEVIEKVGELSPTFGPASRSGMAFWFFLALVISTGAAVAETIINRRLSARALIITGLFIAAATGRRNIVLFAIAAAPLTAESMSRSVPENWRPKKPVIAVTACLMLAFAWFPLSGKYFMMVNNPCRTGFGITPSLYPRSLPAFLKKIGFTGQVLNSNIFGGFYLYHFFPDAVPLTDGRWEVYDVEKLKFIRGATGSAKDWRALAGLYGIKGILLSHASTEARAMLGSLADAEDWRLVYLDSTASFWTPFDRPDQLPAVDLTSASNVPFANRVDDAVMLAYFLDMTDAKKALAVHLERSLRFGQKTELLLERLGHVQMELGRFKEAEQTYGKLLDTDPRSAVALSELAFFAYKRGDLPEALDLISRAVEIEPGNRVFQMNFRRVKEAIDGVESRE